MPHICIAKFAITSLQCHISWGGGEQNENYSGFTLTVGQNSLFALEYENLCKYQMRELVEWTVFELRENIQVVLDL